MSVYLFIYRKIDTYMYVYTYTFCWLCSSGRILTDISQQMQRETKINSETDLLHPPHQTHCIPVCLLMHTHYTLAFSLFLWHSMLMLLSEPMTSGAASHSSGSFGLQRHLSRLFYLKHTHAPFTTLIFFSFIAKMTSLN